MLLQSDLNKWRLSKFSKLDKLYINSASTIPLKKYNIDFIEYKNQRFSNNSHIYLRDCDDASLYHCTYKITVLTIPKWNFILKYCADCPGMNAPYLESPEQLDSLFTASFHKIKFHIFQNTSKCSIHILRPFKYKNTCELYDNI